MSTFDLVAFGLVGFFALWGLFSGFSRQIAAAVAALVAFAGAAPVGRLLAGPVAARLGTSLTVGTVLGTVGAFVALWVGLRFLATAILRRVVAGREGQRRGLDRLLGFGLGGAKAAAAIFVGVCAAVFLENNLVVSGRRFSLTPKDSVVVALARRANVLEYVQFPGARDFATVARASHDPKVAAKLAEDPDFAALRADARFKGLVNQPALKKALATGDVRALLQNDSVLELLRDSEVAARLERLSRAAEQVK